MKKRIEFIKEYLKDPANTGSITPSSKTLKKNIIKHINFSKDFVLVEYGPGNGVFSKDIISKKTKNSIVILIENNYNFVLSLKETFKNVQNVFVIHDSVLNIKNILLDFNLEKVDYVISSIPFLSLGEEFTNNVLLVTKEILKDNSSFILFQYTTVISKKLKKIYTKVSREIVFNNIPPAFIFNCII